MNVLLIAFSCVLVAVIIALVFLVSGIKGMPDLSENYFDKMKSTAEYYDRFIR